MASKKTKKKSKPKTAKEPEDVIDENENILMDGSSSRPKECNEAAEDEGDGIVEDLSGDTEGADGYRKILEELKKIFDILNKEVFDFGIRPPVINVVASKKGPRTICWCSEQQVWKKKDEAPRYFEICFLADGLDRAVIDIAADMAHQMVHIYNSQNGIKDICRGGTYHNQLFKKTAEAHGLDCDAESKAKGYNKISLPPSLQKSITSQIDQSVFDLIREEPPEPPKEKVDKPPTPYDDFNRRLKEVIKEQFNRKAEEAEPVNIAEVALSLAQEIMNDNAPVKTGKGGAEGFFNFEPPKAVILDDFNDEVEDEDYLDEDVENDYDDYYAPQEHAANEILAINNEKNEKSSELMVEYYCPCCNTKILSYGEVQLICGACKSAFEKRTQQNAL